MSRNANGVVLSHWHTLFEDFSTSTQDFYRAVEEAIRRRNLPDIRISRVLFREGGIGSPNREYLRVERRRIAFDICSAPYGNGHFFSWWLARIPPRYGLLLVLGFLLLFLPGWLFLQAIFLRIFADSFFGMFLVLTVFLLGIPVGLLLLGLGVERGIVGDEEWVLSVRVIGYLYALVFNPVTYYRLDTAYMFRDSIRLAVNEVLNGLREEKGLRLLSDEELQLNGPEFSG